MFARLALEEDEDAVVAMGAANVRETLPGQPISEERLRYIFAKYIASANPTIWVVDDRRDVIGFLVAGIGDYDYRDGFFTSQKVLYVRPDKRGTRAAVLLMKQLISWSERLGAVEIVGGNDNDWHSERTAGFLEHFGFERVGFAMTKRLDGHGIGQERSV